MSARRLNMSTAYLALKAEVLASHPDCSVCGGEATEIHSRAGDCCLEGLDSCDVLPVCRSDRDASGCTVPRSTPLARHVDTLIHTAERRAQALDKERRY
jgi:hypothetical protein